MTKCLLPESTVPHDFVQFDHEPKFVESLIKSIEYNNARLKPLRGEGNIPYQGLTSKLPRTTYQCKACGKCKIVQEIEGKEYEFHC